jgi:hypothetical protein
MKRLKEQDIQKTLLDYLRLKKVVCWKNRSVGIMKPDGRYIPVPAAEKGVSDIVGCMPGGRMVAIEVKRPGGHVSPDQQNFLEG